MIFLTNHLAPWIDPRVRGVRVADVQAYLLRRGWKLRPSPRPQLLLFEGPPADDGEPLLQAVPSSESGSDFVQRIIDVITNLSVLEDRYAVEILNDMLMPARQVPAPAPVAPQGTNPSTSSNLTENKPA